MTYWLKIAAFLIASLAMSFLIINSVPGAVANVALHVVVFGALIFAINRLRERRHTS